MQGRGLIQMPQGERLRRIFCPRQVHHVAEAVAGAHPVHSRPFAVGDNFRQEFSTAPEL